VIEVGYELDKQSCSIEMHGQCYFQQSDIYLLIEGLTDHKNNNLSPQTYPARRTRFKNGTFHVGGKFSIMHAILSTSFDGEMFITSMLDPSGLSDTT
jgi:hypothetical protein